MVITISEALLIEIARTPPTRYRTEAARQIMKELTLKGRASYRKLENAFYSEQVQRGSEKYKAIIVRALKSPLYDDAAKKYFAALHLSDEFILLSADKFLTEKIILSYTEDNWMTLFFSLPYFAALMQSAHLSERLVLAAIQKIAGCGEQKTLELIPDRMITPKVVDSWLANIIQLPNSLEILRDWKAVAAKRIMRIHPEYNELPHEWILKVFCESSISPVSYF